MVRYPTVSSSAKAQAERGETPISDQKALKGDIVRTEIGLGPAGDHAEASKGRKSWANAGRTHSWLNRYRQLSDMSGALTTIWFLCTSAAC